MKELSALEQGIQVIRDFVKTLPSKPGVYRMINASQEVLYVGKAKRLNHRVASYTQVNRLPIRLQRMVAEVVCLEVVETHTETEALLLEQNLIKRFQPRYNVLLKDDKAFPYIAISQNHPFPRLSKHRGPKESKTLYFGPFASSHAVDETLIVLQKIFQLRTCTDSFFANRQRPCLQYYIKRCTAPCVNKVAEKDYKAQVKQTIDFFKGRTDQVQQYLSQQMQTASDALSFEEAAVFRDRLRLLAQVQSRQRVNVHDLTDADVLGLVQESGQACIQVFFFRQGRNFGTESFFLSHHQESDPAENLSAFILQFYQDHTPPKRLLLSHEIPEKALVARALAEKFGYKIVLEIPRLGIKHEMIDHALQNAHAAIRRKLLSQNNFDEGLRLIQEVFHLQAPPGRVEVYDNSHIQGANPYGVMVVATPQGFERKSYRKFALEPHGNDDYAMMREVLRRRFARIGEEGWPLPDVVLIDGGQGQLSAACEVIDKLDVEGIQVIAIAKGPDRNAGHERFFRPNQEPFGLPHASPVLHFLQRLRDEAHRFAIGSHRTGRQKQLIRSVLDDVPGIGAKRKKALLLHFGSAQSVARAALADLEKVSGINKAIAKKIYNYFHER